MRAAVFHGPADIRVEDVPDPRIERPDDALVRITHACVCGSDLWIYRGAEAWYRPGMRIGHEWMGVVEAVGPEVRTVRPGDRVIAPFAFSDGTCGFCREGLHTSCPRGGYWAGAGDGGQAEAIRCPLADGTLVRVPDLVAGDEALLRAILPLSDVMSTGHHAAVSAGVRPGTTACVVGDGAVGLCGVLAARRLGAERVIVVGHHQERLALARRLGATDVVTARGDAAAAAVAELTGGGARSVLECVGAQPAMETAIAACRDGGTVGFVGWPHGVRIDAGAQLYGRNVGVRGGVCPARAYIPALMADVLAGRLDPSPVLDLVVPLEEVARGYAAMDAREAVKAMVVTG